MSESSLAEQLAEKFLEEKEILKYKFMVEAAPGEMAICDSWGSLIYCNKSYLKFVGCDSLDEVRGDNWQKVISDSDRERVLGGFAKFILNKVEKFWGMVKYKNLKTNSETEKKVVCSKIQNNGYAIYLMSPGFEIGPDFIEANYP